MYNAFTNYYMKLKIITWGKKKKVKYSFSIYRLLTVFPLFNELDQSYTISYHNELYDVVVCKTIS